MKVSRELVVLVPFGYNWLDHGVDALAKLVL